MKTLVRIVAVIFFVVCHTGADWPQWRGPHRDGHSAETAVPSPWPTDGPKLAWSLRTLDKIGTGYGSPAVVGDRLYIVGATGAKQTASEFVTCLNIKDGSQVWRRELTLTPGKFSDGWGGGPRSTPTVVGDALYVLGSTGDLVCLGTQAGEIRWHKNLVNDFGGVIPIWGYSESPLVDDNRVVCTPGNGDSMVALDCKTGATVWKCVDFSDKAGYSSIVITHAGGVKHYVQQTMESGVGLRASDGKKLWQVSGIKRAVAVIPTPVLFDNFVFFTSGYRAGCECYRLEKDGDGVKAEEVYADNKIVANHHGGVLRVGDFIYGHSDAAGWVCFDMKKGGDPVWKTKGLAKGSVSFADGLLYCFAESDGTLTRVRATHESYQEVDKFKIPQTSKVRPSSGKVWAHPVIAAGKLFLRDYELLYAYDLETSPTRN